ncbi:MAG: ComEC/Rec2 family competence protein [Chlamydiae bacterium]|nr:ComEC/Rec2 family competence protein [Chlamydiota bacterium]
MVKSSHILFYRENPALLFGATLLVTAGSALFWEGNWKWTFLILWGLYLLVLRKWPYLLLLPAMFIYCHLTCSIVPDREYVKGIFQIASLEPHSSPFQKGWLYKGRLFLTEGTYPCTITLHGETPTYPADQNYIVSGKLIPRNQFEIVLKPYREWTPIEGSWSLAHIRFLAKEKWHQFLKRNCKSNRSADFLSALTTGNLEDRSIKYEFSRLGLQHLLAISGFHFATLIAFLIFAFSLCLSHSSKWLILLILLTLYYLFVGPLPGVERSWLTAVGYLVGRILKRQGTAINLLGFSLGCEVTLNPLIVSNIGFQLSFASCLGILLLHSAFERFLRNLLPKRTLKEKLQFSIFEKHILILSSFWRQTLALTFAVNIAILPILLAHFSTFPLLSLLYNLFFPLCVGLLLCLLLIATSFQLLPLLSKPLFSLLSFLTDALLELASYPPSTLDIPLLIPNFPAWAVPFCLFGILVSSLLIKSLSRYQEYI